MNAGVPEQLLAMLWPNNTDPAAEHVYWLLDGARDPSISRQVRYGELKFWCLYSGPMTPRFRASAPYLVHLTQGSQATAQLLANGWGCAWGILIKVPATLSMAELRLHLKKLLRVQTEDGQMLLFRYFDPRVLSVYLPSCTEEEFSTFLGPAKSVVVELNDGARGRMFSGEAFPLHSDVVVQTVADTAYE